MEPVYVGHQIDVAKANVKNFITGGLQKVDRLYLRSSNVESPAQYFFSHRPIDTLESKLYELVLNHATISEQMGPQSFLRCLESIAGGLGKVSLAEFTSTIKRSIDDAVDHSRSAYRSDVSTFIGAACHDSTVSEALLQAIDVAGFRGRIALERTESSTLSVEKVSGYTFDLCPAFTVNVVMTDPRVVVIDGLIESVSEMHHLLESSHNAREPLVIFARGLGPDVINTLKVNFDCGRLLVVPVIVQYDLEGLNTLNDIAVISGGDVVSSLKGDLISSIEYSELSRVDRVTVGRNRLGISCTRTVQAVADHTAELIRRRQSADVVDMSDLYDRRLKSLSPNYVIVRVPSCVDFVVVQQSLDVVLRSIKSAMDHGVVETDTSVLPTVSFVAPLIMALKCIRMIDGLGAVVID